MIKIDIYLVNTEYLKWMSAFHSHYKKILRAIYMLSPADMGVIQIDVTNACVHSCSNCTRFCGHHRKPYFMEVETFKQAVDSLEGFPKMIGIMGGEPTIHPKFDLLMRYYAESVKANHLFKPLTRPIRDFAQYRNLVLCYPKHNRGLFTSLGNKYYEHFELIQDVFPFQLVNDHCNPGLHQALMITRKELGIPDDEWFKLRDKCWIQNLWSASITPKGAFFCEIAGCLDMLFDGPGGWTVEPGWWRRKPEEFKDQLHWCELCSAALMVPRCPANEERDIVSPLMLSKLEQAGSPKIRKGKFTLFNPDGYSAKDYEGNREDAEWYLPEGDVDARVSGTNKSLFPRAVSVVSADKAREGLENFSDWCVVLRDARPIPSNMTGQIKNVILNPGCAYYHIPGCSSGASAVEIAEKADFFLFNRRASALSMVDRLSFNPAMVSRWKAEKLISLEYFPELVFPPSWTHRAKDVLRRLKNRTLWKIRQAWRQYSR